MHVLIRLVVLTVYFLSSVGMYADSKFSEIKGSFKLLKDSDYIPELEVAYDGVSTINNREGFFSIPLFDSNFNQFSLIISNKITCTIGKNNTIKNFGIIPNKNYKHFIFTRTLGADENWLWREEKELKDDFAIPERAIVVRLNPAFVSHLEPWDLVSMSSSIIKLPRIVLLPSLATERQSIQRASAKSLLYALDTKPFHEHNKEKKGVHGNGLIEVHLPGNNQG